MGGVYTLVKGIMDILGNGRMEWWMGMVIIEIEMGIDIWVGSEMIWRKAMVKKWISIQDGSKDISNKIWNKGLVKSSIQCRSVVIIKILSKDVMVRESEVFGIKECSRLRKIVMDSLMI